MTATVRDDLPLGNGAAAGSYQLKTVAGEVLLFALTPGRLQDVG